MSANTESRPLAELLGGLATDISTLFRKEIQLAKAEASEKASHAVGGIEMMLFGGVLALGALGVLLAGIVALLASVLVAQGMDETLSNAVAAVAVALIVGLIGWSMIGKGRSALKTTNLNMNRTVDSIARDANVVKERL